MTICTHEKEHYFGKIQYGDIILTEIGRIADILLSSLPQHYPYIKVPLHVVMPNHIHAIISILDSPCIPIVRSALSVVIGGYKQAVTRYARKNNIEFRWQTRYHDHIIRGSRDGNKITEYIKNNVAKWDSDCYNS